MINISIEGRGGYNHIIQMFATIELFGSIGHSETLHAFVDGDGVSEFKFTFDDPTLNERYQELKKKLLNQYNETNHWNTKFEL